MKTYSLILSVLIFGCTSSETRANGENSKNSMRNGTKKKSEAPTKGMNLKFQVNLWR